VRNAGRFGEPANPGPPAASSSEPAYGGGYGTTPPLGRSAHSAGIDAAGNQGQKREERNVEGLLSSYHEAIVAGGAYENVRNARPST
jgi:hypothetical protein